MIIQLKDGSAASKTKGKIIETLESYGYKITYIKYRCARTVISSIGEIHYSATKLGQNTATDDLYEIYSYIAAGYSYCPEFFNQLKKLQVPAADIHAFLTLHHDGHAAEFNVACKALLQAQNSNDFLKVLNYCTNEIVMEDLENAEEEEEE